jgi:hypothetical protein
MTDAGASVAFLLRQLFAPAVERRKTHINVVLYWGEIRRLVGALAVPVDRDLL